MDYIKSYYDLPFLKPGTKLEMDGKKCKAVKEKNGRLQVKFENGSEGPIHPTWETVYFDENGNILKDFRKKKTVQSSSGHAFSTTYAQSESMSGSDTDGNFARDAARYDFDNASERFSGFGSEDGGSFGGGGASGDWNSGSSDSSSSDNSYSE